MLRMKMPVLLPVTTVPEATIGTLFVSPPSEKAPKPQRFGIVRQVVVEQRQILAAILHEPKPYARLVAITFWIVTFELRFCDR